MRLHEDSFELDIEQHRLRPLDVALARFMAERDLDATPSLLWLTALLSRQLADGHLCLDLDALAEQAHEQDWPASWRERLRGLDAQRAVLLKSPLVADGAGNPANAPLVLDSARLYLRRYWNHECQVAAAIRERLSRTPDVPLQLTDELTRLFPPSPNSTAGAHPVRESVTPQDPSRTGCAPATSSSMAADALNWPKIACALAARGTFTVITGGPGTGKTTTVVRLLGLLQTLQLREHTRPLRIRLAAPTGKAAARLNASIAAQLAQLDVDDSVRAAIPAEVDTLHRLLGARPDTRRFRHDRTNPLHLDVLVVDEASMIDLEMMSAVLAALPAAARLILLGDKDQLSSVEAGAVLGDLCRRADDGHYDAATADWLHAITGDDIRPFMRDDAQPLDQQLAMLRHSHRFDDRSGIGELAHAVNSGNRAAVRALLTVPSRELSWIDSGERAAWLALAIDGDAAPASQARATSAADTARPGYRHYLQQLQRERPAEGADAAAYERWARDVLLAFNRFQLLCALRQGPRGVQGLNLLIAEALQQRGLITSAHGWYEGRPVMLSHNDYNLGLANGDVGLCLRLPDSQGRLRLAVAFLSSAADAAAGTRVRAVPPSRLGEVDTVYAMTVHKSQGSEFDHTALMLPDDITSGLTRELLYTGITRARRWFSLVGSQAVIDHAVAQRTRRYSGLAERLGGA